MNIIAFDQVHLSRPAPADPRQQVPVLAGISCTVRRGEVLGIVGPSGAGKTTLLHLVNRMLDADQGTIQVGDRSVREWQPQALRRYAALAFQSAPMLPGTVLDNLQAPLTLAGQRLTRAAAAEWLAKVDLAAALLDQESHSLSGGQRQRVALLRTLVAQPAILLVDEVTSALDSDSAHLVERVITEQVQASGRTVLWITHDEQQARRVAHRILRLEAGRVVWLGPAAAYERQEVQA